MNHITLAERIANLRSDALNLESEGRGDMAHHVHQAMTALQHRADYAAGLRQLADLLEQNDQLPLPYHGDSTSLTFMFLGSGEDNRAALAEAVKVIPGRLDKNARGDYFDVEGSLHGLKIQLTAYRNDVCERVVIGTETVTIPATPATEAKPEQVVEREIVEWRCQPILAETADETAVA